MRLFDIAGIAGDDNVQAERVCGPASIRGATPADAGAILGIYAPYVADTCVSFETDVPTAGEFAARMENILKSYPYLVCETGGKIAGYAYAAKHGERAAYRHSADVSVYVAPEYQRRGIGMALYERLFELMKAQGLYTAFAGIALPNEKSVGLHKAVGFKEAGVHHNAGYKFGNWLDVMWMEKPLRDYDNPEQS